MKPEIEIVREINPAGTPMVIDGVVIGGKVLLESVNVFPVNEGGMVCEPMSLPMTSAVRIASAYRLQLAYEQSNKE